MNTDMQFHEYCSIFPEADESTLNEMADNIAKNGLQEAIVLLEGNILDGKNRYLACLKANVKPHFSLYEGDDPLGYVVCKNLHRRHLTPSQRAMTAEKLANMPKGRPKKTAENSTISTTKAAKLFGVSRDSVQQARKVHKDAIPEVVEAVNAGKLAVSVAATLSNAPEEQQREIITLDDKKAICAVVQAIQHKAEQTRQELLQKIDSPKQDEPEASMPSTEQSVPTHPSKELQVPMQEIEGICNNEVTQEFDTYSVDEFNSTIQDLLEHINSIPAILGVALRATKSEIFESELKQQINEVHGSLVSIARDLRKRFGASYV